MIKLKSGNLKSNLDEKGATNFFRQVNVVYRFIFLIIFLFLHLGVKPINPDSLKLNLERLSISEQLKIIDGLKFNDVIGNCQKITPILLKFEKIANENKRFNSLAKIYLNLSLSNYYLGKYDENLKCSFKSN